MTAYDKIDQCKYLFVTALYEPKENELVVEVALGSISSLEEELLVGNVNLGPVKEITHDSKSEVYVIYFASYISYLILNESYYIGLAGDFSGNSIREYSNSSFIEFCRKETIGLQINDDKKVRHYEILTGDHIIQILTTSKPEIRSKE
jgi:hypothetical protein